MAQGSDEAETPKGWRRVYFWTKPVDGASPSQSQPQDGPTTSSTADGTQEKTPEPVDFPANFSEQGPNNRVSIKDAVRTIKKEDFLNIGQIPCGRQGFMTGIASGAAIGGVRWVLMGKWRIRIRFQALTLVGSIPKAANWAVWSGIIASVASYEFCQFKRRHEKAQMQRTISIYTEKRKEEAKRQEEEARSKAEEAARMKTKSWTRFW
jgi:cytochrome c oxidase assembly protein subunit 20